MEATVMAAEILGPFGPCEAALRAAIPAVGAADIPEAQAYAVLQACPGDEGGTPLFIEGTLPPGRAIVFPRTFRVLRSLAAEDQELQRGIDKLLFYTTHTGG